MIKSLTVLRCALAIFAFSFAFTVSSEEPSSNGCNLNQGEKLFKKCAICHTNDTSGKHGIVGPNLYNIANRPVGKVDGYKFSSSLRNSEDHWTVALLDSFLKRPMDVYPRTRMAFSGIKKAQDRADLICFLSRNNSTQN